MKRTAQTLSPYAESVCKIFEEMTRRNHHRDLRNLFASFIPRREAEGYDAIIEAIETILIVERETARAGHSILRAVIGPILNKIEEGHELYWRIPSMKHLIDELLHEVLPQDATTWRDYDEARWELINCVVTLIGVGCDTARLEDVEKIAMAHQEIIAGCDGRDAQYHERQARLDFFLNVVLRKRQQAHDMFKNTLPAFLKEKGNLQGGVTVQIGHRARLPYFNRDTSTNVVMHISPTLEEEASALRAVLRKMDTYTHGYGMKISKDPQIDMNGRVATLTWILTADAKFPTGHKSFTINGNYYPRELQSEPAFAYEGFMDIDIIA